MSILGSSFEAILPQGMGDTTAESYNDHIGSELGS